MQRQVVLMVCAENVPAQRLYEELNYDRIFQAGSRRSESDELYHP